jgi:thymidylate synthase
MKTFRRMNEFDEEYKRLLRLILDKGRVKKNRTGVNTIGVFGAQARFDLSKGFPLLTTKKMFTKGIIHELLWFISGSTNIKYLVDNDVNIWNKDAYRRYLETFKGVKRNLEPDAQPISIEKFVNLIKEDSQFANNWGNLGEGTYGGMWRAFPYYPLPVWYDDADEACANVKSVDQLSKAIDKLKNNPDDRRIIVNAWHPYWVDHCVLPPCHVLFQFNTEELTEHERLTLWQKRFVYEDVDGQKFTPSGLPTLDIQNFSKIAEERFDKDGVPRRRLNCLMYQRSCDTFLGVPFNIASYSLLTCMVAQCVNMVPGDFVHTFGDLHLYENHIEQAKEQLGREPKDAPLLKLNSQIKDLFAFKFEDISIEGYDPHPPIKGEMST